MDKTIIKAIKIETILESLGRPLSGSKGMYYSPFREETTPSFHINQASNLWYDFGLGAGGDNIQLLMKLQGWDFKKSVQYLATLTPVPTEDIPRVLTRKQPLQNPTITTTHNFESGIVITGHGSIQSSALFGYGYSRGIPAKVLARYCKQVSYKNRATNREYYALGFMNNSGGYALRTFKFKGTSKADITTLGSDGKLSRVPTSSKTLVFEGFFDYLSYLAMNDILVPGCDVLVLNSTAMLPRSNQWLGAHETIDCYLDRDDTGRKALEKISEGFPGGEVSDKSTLYQAYNDLNEYHMACVKLNDSLAKEECKENERNISIGNSRSTREETPARSLKR